MKILILDNFDSYTFNLYQSIGGILSNWGQPFELAVKRNNEITAAEIRAAGFDRIVISPGPGDPSEKAYFGVCAEVISDIGRTVPVLGVCLGMQGMVHVFGGRVVRAPLPMHGKTSEILHDGKGVFHGLPQQLSVMRYHSLMAEPASLPPVFEVSAVVRTDEAFAGLALAPSSIIMGLRHREFPIEGVQFHPESFATEGGVQLIENFLARR